jgi:Permease for cytosine/purines, uracil, thiamine, allantoin
MLRAIAPSIDNVPNTFPDSSGTTSKAFIGFIVFWFVSLFAIWVPVERIRHLFTVKSILLPIAAFSLFIWSIIRAHGLGPIISQPATFTSSEQAAWAIINGITGCMGNMAALVCSEANVFFVIQQIGLTRYHARSSIHQILLVTRENPVISIIHNWLPCLLASSLLRSLVWL